MSIENDVRGIKAELRQLAAAVGQQNQPTNAIDFDYQPPNYRVSFQKLCARITNSDYSDKLVRIYNAKGLWFIDNMSVLLLDCTSQISQQATQKR